MRTPLIILSLSLLSGLALAAPGWQECRQLPGNAERLACYDDYAAMLEKKNAPPTQEEQKAAFGLPKTSPADTVQGVQAGIRKIEKTSRGQRILYLDNDQVWRQVGNSSQPRLKSGDTITIERGALGSFVLRQTNSNRSMRVKRLR
ncbi:hypothetical protein [Thiolapillus brandeum]|uniref:Uncharacterized protein n=1 Tax=Thiolapillus brandeum TaxID=1076588 RepID=A0A7U6GJD9_9GAMM|nr:hypothetical protein [Thiolapillus brandeum]BAO44702.1 hypothetical protein TBH_C1786 [Thiolapillus brandeum]